MGVMGVMGVMGAKGSSCTSESPVVCSHLLLCRRWQEVKREGRLQVSNGQACA